MVETGLKTVLKYMRRSPYQSISAFLIMWLTFFVISVFAILTVLSIRVIDHLKSSPQLMIFFTETVEPEDIEALKTTLEATGKTKSVRYGNTSVTGVLFPVNPPVNQRHNKQTYRSTDQHTSNRSQSQRFLQLRAKVIGK